MSKSKLIEVPVPEPVYQLLEQFSRNENRSVGELIEIMTARYERDQEMMRRSAEAMARMQAESVRNGNCNMSLDEINEEIAAARKEMAMSKTA